MLNYIPVVLFGLWGYQGLHTLPSLRDPAVVRHPESQFWHPVRFLRDDTWTESAQGVRWQYLRHWVMGSGLGSAGFLIAGLLDHCL